jgi:hypothetical protein
VHEAALALAVAEQIRQRGMLGRPMTLLVSGGHADADAFDAALRLHLAASEPRLDTDALTIVHLLEERPCLSCGQSFAAVGQLADCPYCGGVGPLRARPEKIEIALDTH